MLNGQLALDAFAWNWLTGKIQPSPEHPPEDVTLLHFDSADGVIIDLVWRPDDLKKFQEGTALVEPPSAIQRVGAIPAGMPTVDEILRNGHRR